MTSLSWGDVVKPFRIICKSVDHSGQVVPVGKLWVAYLPGRAPILVPPLDQFLLEDEPAGHLPIGEVEAAEAAGRATRWRNEFKCPTCQHLSISPKSMAPVQVLPHNLRPLVEKAAAAGVTELSLDVLRVYLCR